MEILFIDIAIEQELLGSQTFSRRAILPFLGLPNRKSVGFYDARSLKARSLAIKASDEAMNMRDRGLASDTTILAFRLDLSINWLTNQSIRKEITDTLAEYGKRRHPSNPQILLYSVNYEHRVEVLNNDSDEIGKLDAGELLGKLRQHELTDFLGDGRVLYEHGGTAYFEIPSGFLRDYFIRIGNTQSIPNFTNSVFFWALPHLNNVTHFFAESWSISTTAATFALLQNSYSGNTSCRWAFGHSYIPNSEVEKERLSLELDKARRNRGKLLLINSFNSSGRLAEEFKKISGALSPENAGMLSLYVDSRTEIPNHAHLCDLADHIRNLGLNGETSLPVQSEAPVFSVSANTYFPDYRRPKVWKFKFRELDYDKRFFERYSGKGIFSVNRRGRNATASATPSIVGSMRHHAYHVDVTTLFKGQEFRSRLRECCEGRPPPTALLTNGTEGANELRKAFLAAIGDSDIPTLVCNDPSYSRLPSANGLSDILSDKTQRLLVFVPLVISGSTLGNVQIELRKLSRLITVPKCDISIIVGLLRPDSQVKLQQLRDFYLKRSENASEGWVDPIVVESVLLPNWQEDKCPWQRERLILGEKLGRKDISDKEFFRLSRRVDELGRTVVDGLSGTNVFFTEDNSHLQFNPESLWLDDDKVDQPFDFLGKKSAETHSSEGDLCCAVASAIQHWREVASRTDWRFNVIDASTITNLNGFNEPRLRAAIWRALTPEESKNTARLVEGSDLKPLLEKIFNGKADDNYTPLRDEARLAFQNEIERSLG